MASTVANSVMRQVRRIVDSPVKQKKVLVSRTTRTTNEATIDITKLYTIIDNGLHSEIIL